MPRQNSNYNTYSQYAERAALTRKTRYKRLHRKSRFLRVTQRARIHGLSTTSTVTRTENKIMSALYGAKQTTVHKLVATTLNISPVVPLVFQRPAAVVIKSLGAKNKAVLASITSKEARYKITAQYTESLLEFIPAFISQLLSKKININNEHLDYSTTQYLIRNIY